MNRRDLLKLAVASTLAPLAKSTEAGAGWDEEYEVQFVSGPSICVRLRHRGWNEVYVTCDGIPWGLKAVDARGCMTIVGKTRRGHGAIKIRLRKPGGLDIEGVMISEPLA